MKNQFEAKIAKCESENLDLQNQVSQLATAVKALATSSLPPHSCAMPPQQQTVTVDPLDMSKVVEWVREYCKGVLSKVTPPASLFVTRQEFNEFQHNLHSFLQTRADFWLVWVENRMTFLFGAM